MARLCIGKKAIFLKRIEERKGEEARSENEAASDEGEKVEETEQLRPCLLTSGVSTFHKKGVCGIFFFSVFSLS